MTRAWILAAVAILAAGCDSVPTAPASSSARLSASSSAAYRAARARAESTRAACRTYAQLPDNSKWRRYNFRKCIAGA